MKTPIYIILTLSILLMGCQNDESGKEGSDEKEAPESEIEDKCPLLEIPPKEMKDRIESKFDSFSSVPMSSFLAEGNVFHTSHEGLYNQVSDSNTIFYPVILQNNLSGLEQYKMLIKFESIGTVYNDSVQNRFYMRFPKNKINKDEYVWADVSIYTRDSIFRFSSKYGNLLGFNGISHFNLTLSDSVDWYFHRFVPIDCNGKEMLSEEEQINPHLSDKRFNDLPVFDK